MNKSVGGVLVAVLAVGGIFLVVSANKPDKVQPASTSSTNPSQPSTIGNNQPAAPNAVTIKDYAFKPAKITVKKGTTITWTNQDDSRHDITPDKESGNFVASELLSQGNGYSFTFNTVGTYTYHCSPHPYMKATVEVTD